jgi:hypothetical protein
MQGLQSLNQFKDFVSSIGGLGRYEDTYIVHAAEGETVVPMEVLDQNPVLKKRLFKTMMDMGIEPGRYIVGNELNSKNPITGQPEFFLKKIVSQIRKALPGDSEQFLGPLIGLATGNPFYGAIAGGIGSGVGGAITGGGAGLLSPGLSTFGGKAGGIMELLRGSGQVVGPQGPMMPTKGIVGSGGKFGFGEGTISDAFNKYMGFGEGTGKGGGISYENLKAGIDAGIINEDNFDDIISSLGRDDKLSLQQLLKVGVPITIALGMVIDKTNPQGDIGLPADIMPPGEVKQGIVNPVFAAQGGVMDLQDGGESKGPGTGTSDSIPAMLSDGEFVMTAKAVRGAGGGDRREGAKKMYEAMDKLEAQA